MSDLFNDLFGDESGEVNNSLCENTEENTPVNEENTYTQGYSDSSENSAATAQPVSYSALENSADNSNADSTYTNPYANSYDSQPQQQNYGGRYYTPQYSGEPQHSSEPQYGTTPYTPQYNPYASQPQHYGGSAPTPPVKSEKERKKSFSAGFVALMLVVCILLSSVLGFAGAMLYTKMKVADTGISDNGTMIINKVDIDEQTSEKLTDKSTSQIADEVADTVVEITTEVMTTNSFYGQYVSQGAGSGVIISTDGYIVTNNHVIENASSITVTLRDQTSYQAQLIGKDSIVDVALLKIDATGLQAANFGDSDSLKVGDKAVAIGNPLGQLGGTVTDGIISALDRDVVIDNETMTLLQTDSAINPGNSGGGLFDGQGALIGVVVAKSSGEEIEGLGFAIPINDVVDILDDLKEYGYVRGRVSIGMDLIDLTNSMYSMYYFGNTQAGCYVYSVDFESSASAAGIQQGDRIVSVDGKEVTCVDDVEKAIDGKQVGDSVELVIERGGRTASVEVELVEYVPDDVLQKQNTQTFDPFA